MSLTRADAAHLLRRSGFAARPAHIDKLTGMTRRAAVAAVVDFTDTNVTGPTGVGDTSRSWWDRYVTMSHHWYQRMLTTPHPLAEKMTLFWHGVLTSSIEGADHVSMMNQNLVLRRRGLGNFADLVNAIAIDPAMLQYLSNDRNVKAHPNENFGRELLELFTLGVGNYSQDDVIASSRAWTGHNLHKTDGAPPTYQFRAEHHDTGTKTFLGRTRNFDGPDIVAEIVTGAGQASSARHITRRLWTFLAYPNPEPVVIDAVANTYIASGHSIRELVRAVFLHDAFWSTRARSGLLRSPIELQVAAMAHMGLAVGEYHPEWYDAAMGQRPFYPPNVGGWLAGASWLSTSATWAWNDAAMHAMWRASDAGTLPDTRPLSVPAAATAACAHVGITHITAQTRSALEGAATAFRAQRHWGESHGLVVLALISPEFRQA